MTMKIHLCILQKFSNIFPVEKKAITRGKYYKKNFKAMKNEKQLGKYIQK